MVLIPNHRSQSQIEPGIETKSFFIPQFRIIYPLSAFKIIGVFIKQKIDILGKNMYLFSDIIVTM